MYKLSSQLIAIIALVIIAPGIPEAKAESGKIVLCFYPGYSYSRSGDGRFDVVNINTDLCTHVAYAWVSLGEEGTVIVSDAWNSLPFGNDAFRRLNDLKKTNPNLKTIISMGGWDDGSEKYSRVFANETLRKKFANKALEFLQKYGFDGFDMHWKFPTHRGGNRADVPNLAKLLKEMREVFGNKYILTTTVAGVGFYMKGAYDVDALNKYCDFINVIDYDLNGAWNQITGQNSPFKPSSLEPNNESTAKACIDNWVKAGGDRSKLLMGIPTFGRSFTLQDPDVHGPFAPVTGKGDFGPYSTEQGMLGFNDILEFYKEGNWTVVWDKDQEVPYMYKGNQWVGFEIPKSVRVKADYAKYLNLGGVFIWSLDTDDFRGVSGNTYPLLKTVNAVLRPETRNIACYMQANKKDLENLDIVICPDLLPKYLDKRRASRVQIDPLDLIPKTRVFSSNLENGEFDVRNL